MTVRTYLKPTRSRINTHSLVAFTLACAVFGAPVQAHADSGTPLIVVGIAHLFYLNVLIGLLEAALLCRVYHLRRWPTITIIILANYFSAWVGAISLYALWQPFLNIFPGSSPLLKAAPVFVTMIILSWLLSIILEWPFVAFAMKKTPSFMDDRWRKHGLLRSSFTGSVIAQSASYALLIPLYLSISPTSMVFGNHLQQDLRFVKVPTATVLYLDNKGNSLWSIRTDGSQRTKIMNTGVATEWPRIYVSENAVSHEYDLYIIGERESSRRLLVKGVGKYCAVTDKTLRGFDEQVYDDGGRPADFRRDDDKRLNAIFGFWASEGVMTYSQDAANLPRTNRERLAFDTPFANWFCRAGTILPNSQLVFQIGPHDRDDMVAILDLPTQKLGFLTMGHSPVVVLDRSDLRRR